MADDPNANRALQLIERNGYTVELQPDSIATTHTRTRETFIVRGADALKMAAELAGQVGIELMDGCAAARRSRRDVHRESQWQ